MKIMHNNEQQTMMVTLLQPRCYCVFVIYYKQPHACLAGDERLLDHLRNIPLSPPPYNNHPFIKDGKIFVPQDKETGGYQCRLHMLCGKSLTYRNWTSVYRHLSNVHNLLASQRNTFLLSRDGQQVRKKQRTASVYLFLANPFLICAPTSYNSCCCCCNDIELKVRPGCPCGCP